MFDKCRGYIRFASNKNVKDVRSGEVIYLLFAVSTKQTCVMQNGVVNVNSSRQTLQSQKVLSFVFGGNSLFDEVRTLDKLEFVEVELVFFCCYQFHDHNYNCFRLRKSFSKMSIFTNFAIYTGW